MEPVGGQGHHKSQRWLEITNAVQVKIKYRRGTHLSRVKLTWSELSLPWQNSRPLFWACLSVISNPKALSSVWPSFKSPVPFLNCQVCSMPFFRHSFELIPTEIFVRVVPFRREIRVPRHFGREFGAFYAHVRAIKQWVSHFTALTRI